jgi:Rhodopirellula transposase DDE domain
MVALVEMKYDNLASMMDERLKRHWAACEALAVGYGGVSEVARATGLSRSTIRKGIAEVQGTMPQLAREIEGRVRRPGGGRRTLARADATLCRDLESLVADSTRGDPVSPLLWTCHSTRTLAAALRERGHTVSHMTVDRLLHDMDYSLRSNRKIEEGKQSPDRDAQFRWINRRVRAFQRRGQPVISVDAKHREILGNMKNPGKEWRPPGKPRRVRTHDFPDETLGHAIPFGVFDVSQNEGWVSVGIDHNTAEFAAAAILRWWREMGHHTYPQADSLLVTADSGGSNSARSRLWKVCLQEICDKMGLTITVCHFPPGTSKWNAIEHRMFCHISQNWRGRPLESRAVVVNSIAHTRTTKGLHIQASLDPRPYPLGIKVSDEELGSVHITHDKFHGDWNYTIRPA